MTFVHRCTIPAEPNERRSGYLRGRREKVVDSLYRRILRSYHRIAESSARAPASYARAIASRIASVLHYHCKLLIGAQVVGVTATCEGWH